MAPRAKSKKAAVENTAAKEVKETEAKVEKAEEKAAKAKAEEKKTAEVKASEKKATEPKPAQKAIETKKDSTKAIETKAGVLVGEEPVKEEKKPATKKSAAKKPVTEKKPAAKKPTAKAEVKTEMFLQFSGKEYTEKDIFQRVKEVWTKVLKNKVGDMKDVKIYLKPEESAAYYVVNDDTSGKIDL